MSQFKYGGSHMSGKDTSLMLLVAFLVIAALLLMNQKMGKEIKQLKERIDQDQKLTKDIRRRLLELIQNNQDIDPAVVQELMNISALLEIKQDTKALFGLAKIIERLLKELYQDDPDLQAQKKNLSFSDYLQHALDKNVISKEDFHLISVLRIIRNEEAHEINVHKEQSRVMAAFVAGTSFVLVLSRLIRNKIRPKPAALS